MSTDTTAHGVNVPLLRTVLEVATRHPEKWDQGTWATREPECGTRYCMAGLTLVLSRTRLAWLREVDGEYAEAHRTDDDRSIADVAADLLGLPLIWAVANSLDENHLFNTWNSLNDCWEIASELTHGEIEVPADLPGGAE